MANLLCHQGVLDLDEDGVVDGHLLHQGDGVPALVQLQPGVVPLPDGAPNGNTKVFSFTIASTILSTFERAF